MDREKAMEDLISTLGDGLWTFCLRLTYNKIEAEDLYQDTMLKALELKEAIDFDHNPKAFVYSLAVSINRNRFRKFFRHRRIAPEFDYDLNYIEDISASTEAKVIEKEEKSQVDKAIEKLNDNLKPVILMYYMEELSIKDIASYLSIPEGTVKSRLNTGRKKLKEELEGLRDEE